LIQENVNVPLVEEFARQIDKMGQDEFEKKFEHPFLIAGGLNEDDSLSFETSGDSEWEEAMVEYIYPLKKDDSRVFTFITVGRSRNNHIVIRSKVVSKLHLVIHREKEGYTVMDSGSRNGSSLNDRPLVPQQPQALKTGDVITLAGKITVRYLTPPSAFDYLRKKSSEFR